MKGIQEYSYLSMRYEADCYVDDIQGASDSKDGHSRRTIFLEAHMHCFSGK